MLGYYHLYVHTFTNFFLKLYGCYFILYDLNAYWFLPVSFVH